jgi:hypothetical protein
MTGFELFFRADNFNLGAPLLPNLPPSAKCKKNSYNIFPSASKNWKQNQNEKNAKSGTSYDGQVC